MENGEMTSTPRNSISSSKTSFRGDRNWEVSRIVTAVRSGNQYEIEPTAGNDVYGSKAADSERELQPTASAAPNQGTFTDADAMRFGLTRPLSSLSEPRNGVQLTLYVALGQDAALLSIDRLSQRLVTPQFGAVATFLGVTRRDRHPETGAATNRLVYEAYEQMAIAEMERVCIAAQCRFGVSIAIAHRLGEVLLAEPSFACVCTAPHRDAAFDAVRFAVNEVKARVPIWKREYYENSTSRWLANSECNWSESATNHRGLTSTGATWNNLDTCSLKRDSSLLQHSASSLLANVSLNLTPCTAATSLNADADTSTTSSLNGNGNGVNEATARRFGTSTINASGSVYL